MDNFFCFFVEIGVLLILQSSLSVVSFADSWGELEADDEDVDDLEDRVGDDDSVFKVDVECVI